MVYKSINKFNYLSVLLCSPAIRLGDVEYNKNLIIEQMQLHSSKCNLLVFPELCLTGSTCGDAFMLSESYDELEEAIYSIVGASYEYQSTLIIGAPTPINGKLINCALVICDGKLLGIIPNKTRTRWFDIPDLTSIMFNGYEVVISDQLIFKSFCKLGVCVGALSIHELSQLSSAEVIVCIDASPFSYDGDQTMTDKLSALSKIHHKGIVYVNANGNESTTDGVYDGTMTVVECGKHIQNCLELAQDEPSLTNNINNKLPSFETQYYSAELDIDIIRGSKKRDFINNRIKYNTNKKAINEFIKFDFNEKELPPICRYNVESCEKRQYLKSYYEDPFNTAKILNNPTDALKIINIQALGLAKRMKYINSKSVVIGVSGGVDSTLSLLVAVRTFEILKFDKKNIYAISMPGLGTSSDANEIAEKMCNSLAVSYQCIPITKSVLQHFSDIGHIENDKSVVYENSQARMRAMILFDYANEVGGLVVGTGDMSEAALGWTTYNGDHISNYNVNCGLPKTVIQAILTSISRGKIFPNLDTTQIDRAINRPISPELIPMNEDGKVQATEDILGPYEIHDFILYYHIFYFFSKEKLLYIAKYTFNRKYSEELIEKCCEIFSKRFRANQYKRSCTADGPSIYNFSLSPRGGLVFPSDYFSI